MTSRVAEQIVYLPLERPHTAEGFDRCARHPAASRCRARRRLLRCCLRLSPAHRGAITEAGRGALHRSPADSLQQMEVGLTDNINRGGMDPVDIGLALAAMRDEGLSQNQIAERIGRSAFYVSRYIRLAALPADVRKKIKAKELTVSKALGPTAGIPRAQIFQADEELQKAWLELRTAVIEIGDRKVMLSLQRFAGQWRAFGQAKRGVA